MYHDYHVVLAIGAFIVNTRNSRLLVVKKSLQNRIDAGLWTVPGGKVFKTESLLGALTREVAEEVGLSVTTGRWIGEDVFVSEQETFHAQHFLCRVDADTHITLEKTLTDYAWIDRSDMSTYDFHPNIKSRIQRIFEGTYD